ncbi:MAG: hypothetical protein Q8Q01_00300 [archaeon]|nr:hypothetical protein [archaeon]
MRIIKELIRLIGDKEKKVRILEERLIRSVSGSKILNHIPLEELLESSTKEGVILSEKRKSDYELSPLRAEFDHGRDDYWSRTIFPDGRSYNNVIYLDAPVGIALLYKGWPEAITGIKCPAVDTLMITQIQGIQARIRHSDKSKCFHSRGLAPLKWEELLVKSVEYIAKNLRTKCLGIQGSVNNEWKSKTSSLRLFERYDQIAKQMGFVESDDGNWYKRI